MPLPLPNLDTRRFDDLVAEMRALIPQYAPEWTNHNLSDPGMTLVDLLAWMTEATLYRTNRIPEATYLNFVALLLGERPQQGESLEEAKLRAVRFFNEPYRTVTIGDFEREVKRVRTDFTGVARVKILSDDKEGRVTIVVVPAAGVPEVTEQQVDDLFKKIKEEIGLRKLVCTRIHIRKPVYTEIYLTIVVRQRPNTVEALVQSAVEKIVTDYLDPLTGGPEKTGWPFGRPLSVFELYHLIEPMTDVDHVESIAMMGDDAIREIRVPELLELRYTGPVTDSVTPPVTVIVEGR